MFLLEKYSAGIQPPQDKPEGRKQLKNLDYVIVLGMVSSQKEATATVKERQNFLVKVNVKTYYGLRTMAKNLDQWRVY